MPFINPELIEALDYYADEKVKIIETNRLILCRFTEADSEFIFEKSAMARKLSVPQMRDKLLVLTNEFRADRAEVRDMLEALDEVMEFWLSKRGIEEEEED